MGPRWEWRFSRVFFNDTVSKWINFFVECLNDQWITNWKGCGKDLSWPNLETSLGIYLEVLGKIMRNFRHCSRGSVEIRSWNHISDKKWCLFSFILFVPYKECRVLKKEGFGKCLWVKGIAVGDEMFKNWSAVEWSEVKWSEVKWSEVKWSEGFCGVSVAFIYSYVWVLLYTIWHVVCIFVIKLFLIQCVPLTIDLAGWLGDRCSVSQELGALQTHSFSFLTQQTYSCSNFFAISSFLVLKLLKKCPVR